MMVNDANLECTYKYDAFISYRHLPTDKKIAVRLQRLLEKHKVTKDSSTRPICVFRDESELPTSSDLGEDIRIALSQSRYLVIICSKEYQKSKWCMEELSYFRQLHENSNKNILLLLTEGEPEEVFPKYLRFENRKELNADGNVITQEIEIEPLGADVRAENERKMLQRLNTEYMRIAAPILDCGYDDLYQRRKRNFYKKMIAALSIGLVGVFAFTIYNLSMLNQISEKQQRMYYNESLRLASNSNEAIENSNYKLAMLLAKKALPLTEMDGSRPIVSEAISSLRSAVVRTEAMQKYDYLQVESVIEFTVNSWTICNSFANGTKLAVTDMETTYLYDSKTGALLFSCPGTVVFFNDDATRSARYAKRTIELYDVKSGQCYYSFPYEVNDGNYDNFAIEWDKDICYVIDTTDYYQSTKEIGERIVTIIDRNGIELPIEKASFDFLKKYKEEADFNDYFDGRYYYGGYRGDFDFETETFVRKEFVPFVDCKEYIIELKKFFETDGYTINEMQISDDGSIMVFYADTDSTNYSFIVSTDSIEDKYAISSGEFSCVMETGHCILDPVSNLLYFDFNNSNYLHIMTFHPENLKNGQNSDTINTLSTDASLLLKCDEGDLIIPGLSSYFASFYESDPSLIQIWDATDTSEPIFSKESPRYHNYAMYFATSALDKIVLLSEEGYVEVLNSRGECLLQLKPSESIRYVQSLSISDDGYYLAIAYDGDDEYVELYTVENGKLITTFQFEDETGFSYHMEFQDMRLLLSGPKVSKIIDLNDLSEILTISDGNDLNCHRNFYLTDDGLLLCTSDNPSGHGLDAIYDSFTGEKLWDIPASVFQYEATTGTLLYQISEANVNSPTLVAARRGDDGQFSELYTIESKGAILKNQYVTENYFILSSYDETSVYELDTGTCVMTLLGEGYLLKHDYVYNTRLHYSNELQYFTIDDLDTLLEKVEKYLTSEYGIRNLNELELKHYYLEY